jgi:hypothetical protein
MISAFLAQDACGRQTARTKRIETSLFIYLNPISARG